jgi:hypothetical protein
MARIVVQASLAALPRNPTSDDPSRARDERRFPKNHLRDSDGQMEGRAHVDRRRHPVRMWLLLLALSACDDAAPADAPRDGGAGRDAGSASGRDGGSRGPDAGAMDAGERAPAEVGECGAPDPAWVFCSDFEEGDLDAWDDFDGNPAPDHSIVEDPGPFALAGNHVGRLLPPSGRGGADFVKELPEPLDRAYARWYVQFEAGFDFDARNHGGGLFARRRARQRAPTARSTSGSTAPSKARSTICGFERAPTSGSRSCGSISFITRITRTRASATTTWW